MGSRRIALPLVLSLLCAPSAWAQGKEGKGLKKETGKAKVELVKEGKVRLVRGLRRPEVMLTDEKGKDWRLSGELLGELRRLRGHRIKIWAKPAKTKLATEGLAVVRYQMLKQGNHQPQVGILKERPSGELCLMKKGQKLMVEGRPKFLSRLKEKVGCRVWLVGKIQKETIKAYKFGWLSCEKPKTKKKVTEKETRK